MGARASHNFYDRVQKSEVASETCINYRQALPEKSNLATSSGANQFVHLQTAAKNEDPSSAT